MLARHRGSRAPAPWLFPLLNLHLVPSAGDVERARALKEEGNELVKKGNHKKAIEKYSESLSFSDMESATYSNRYLHAAAGLGVSGWWLLSASLLWTGAGSPFLGFSQYVIARNRRSQVFGHREEDVASGICSLKRTEAESCQSGDSDFHEPSK